MQIIQNKLSFPRISGTFCFFLGLFLIYQEFHLFLVEEPTHSIIKKVEFISKFTPIVQICAEPGINENKIIDAGYETLYAFFSGFKDEDEDLFIGWQSMSKLHPFDFLEDAVILNDSKDIVISAIFDGYDYFSVEAKLEARRILYPYGRCYSILNPKDVKNAVNLEIDLNTSYSGNVKIFFQDPLRDVTFLFSPFALKDVAFDQNYDTIYTLGISLMNHLEDDTCSNYDANSTYGDCVEEEIISKFQLLLNCTPPWFSDNRDDICAGQFSLQQNKQANISNIFFSMFAGTYAPLCPPPCSSLSFTPHYVRSEPARNRSRIYINFPPDVEVTEEKVDVDFLFFVTRYTDFSYSSVIILS